MEASTPAIGVSFQIDLGTGRQIVAQTHIGQEDDPSKLDMLLDKIGAAVERQRLYYRDVARLEAETERLEQQERQYGYLVDDFNRLERARESAIQKFQASGRKGAPELKPAETQQREMALVNLERGKADVERTKALIASIKEKLAQFKG